MLIHSQILFYFVSWNRVCESHEQIYLMFPWMCVQWIIKTSTNKMTIQFESTEPDYAVVVVGSCHDLDFFFRFIYFYNYYTDRQLICAIRSIFIRNQHEQSTRLRRTLAVTRPYVTSKMIETKNLESKNVRIYGRTNEFWIFVAIIHFIYSLDKIIQSI